MKFNEILSLAYDCNCMPEDCTDSSLYNFAMNLLHIERDRCADVIKARLYPEPKTQYQIQYNAGLHEDVSKILHPELYA